MKIATAMAVACLSIVGIAAGQDAQAVVRHYELNIPQQSLDLALRDLAQQTGLQIALFSDSIDGSAVVGPILGSRSAEQALQTLLTPSGLSYKVVSEGTIAILNPKDSPPVSAPTRLRISQAESPRPSEPVAAASQNEDASRIEEIVVTAQKREERLLDVPQAVTVVSAEAISKLGATQFRDFADTLPGLSFQTEGAGLTQVSLRGVTAGKDVSATVGIYVDDVPYGATNAFAKGGLLALDAGLYDLERIEVLRGPQGTLYGASTMGGLIKYVTKQPQSDRLSVDVRSGISNTSDGGLNYDGALTLNAPIAADKAGLRATAFYSHDDGYIDNVALGEDDVNNANIYGGRADLLLTPSDAFRIRISGFLQNITRDGFPLADYSLATRRPVDGSLEQRRLITEPFDQQFRLISATASYDLAWATLTSISSYQTIHTKYILDWSARSPALLTSNNLGALGNLGDTTTDKFTQEVRLASQGKRTLEWALGGFYNHEESEDYQAYIPLDLALQPVPNTLFTFYVPSRYAEMAAFGNVTWNLTDKFDVSGGVRYGKNRQKFQQTGTGLLGRTAPRSDSEEGVFTYLANARYHFNDRATGYVRYATGYRPGGPNFRLVDPDTGALVGPLEFDADELSSYEVGFKAETEGRRFGLDVAAYYLDWSDIQVTVVRGGFGGRDNAPGGATVKGAELTLTARPTTAFTTTAAFSYQDAKLADALPALNAPKGARLPTVPKSNASLSADYKVWQGTLQPTFGATVRYVGERTADFPANAYRLPEYTSVDLRMGFALGKINSQFYVRNVFDEHGQLIPRLLGATNASFPIPISILQPRTVGVLLSTTF